MPQKSSDEKTSLSDHSRIGRQVHMRSPGLWSRISARARCGLSSRRTPVTLMMGSLENRRLSSAWIFEVLSSDVLESHCRRAPARHERHSAEVFVARDVRSPSAFPTIHEPALLAADDNELSAETSGQMLADR